MLTRERRAPESVSAVHSLQARLEEAIVRKEHRAIVDKRIDAPRGVGVINCLLILLSLRDGNNGRSEEDRDRKRKREKRSANE